MKITYKDKFTIIPKRCSYCGVLFFFEPYNIYYKNVGIAMYDLKQIKCKRCINESKRNVNGDR